MPFHPRVRPGHPYLAGAPLFIAHRGGSRLAPENTMEAFRSAVEVWDVDMLELDVHATSDGEIVVFHDPTVDRTTGGTGPICDMTWEAVCELDAGYRFTDLDGHTSFRGRGCCVPRLDEVLETFPAMRLNLEIKDNRAAQGAVERVRAHGAESRVLVAAGQERDRRPVGRYPGPWGASREQLLPFWLLHATPLSFLYTPRVDAMQVPEVWKGRRIVTPRFIEEAHRRNLPIHVWTVDDADDMRRLLSWGVDGIQTDRPDVLARVLHEVTGRPLPPGALPTAAEEPGSTG